MATEAASTKPMSAIMKRCRMMYPLYGYAGDQVTGIAPWWLGMPITDDDRPAS